MKCPHCHSEMQARRLIRDEAARPLTTIATSPVARLALPQSARHPKPKRKSLKLVLIMGYDKVLRVVMVFMIIACPAREHHSCGRAFACVQVRTVVLYWKRNAQEMDVTPRQTVT